MSLAKSSPPYGTQPYPTTRLDIYRSIRLNCELFAGRSVIGVPGSDTLLQAPPQGGQGQHVKYNWRTLQLLPGMERPSYAGAQMEVHEGLDGQLLVQYQGRTIPTQEAPPRPGVLRDSNGPLRYGPCLDRRVNRVGNPPRKAWHPSASSRPTAPHGTATAEFASLRHRHAGNPRRDKGFGGRPCGRLSFGASPFGQPPGSWHPQEHGLQVRRSQEPAHDAHQGQVPRTTVRWYDSGLDGHFP